jgi:hypothetical protein
VLVRCLRGSGLAAALPARVSSCWCAAAASAGGGLRKGLDRAAGRSAARVLGLRLPLWTQSSAFVRRRSKAPAFATGSRRERRSVGPQAHKGRIVGALGGGVGSASPFSWHGPREGRISATSDPVGGGSATWTALGRWQIHRRRRFGGRPTARPARPTHSPRPKTSAVASCPLEALSERRTSRSRASAAPPDHEAAPAQPHSRQKPSRRSRRTRARAQSHPTHWTGGPPHPALAWTS